MSGVFLSYSRADRATASQVVKGLRGLGVDVWWDEDMPGVDWQEELDRQINDLAAVVVLWTPTSVSSKNVKDEARLGQHREKLVNVLVGVSSPPFPFERSNGLPLDGWTGRESHNGWRRLVKTIDDQLARTGAGKAGELTATLARREQAVRDKLVEVAAGEEAYQTAKADEETAANANATAAATYQAAEEQLRRVVDMHGTSTLLRAAQTDLDAAIVARDEANRASRAAAAALAKASRAMTRAKTELERLYDDAPPASPAGREGAGGASLPGSEDSAETSPPATDEEGAEGLASGVVEDRAAEATPKDESATDDPQPKPAEPSAAEKAALAAAAAAAARAAAAAQTETKPGPGPSNDGGGASKLGGTGVSGDATDDGGKGGLWGIPPRNLIIGGSVGGVVLLILLAVLIGHPAPPPPPPAPPSPPPPPDATAGVAAYNAGNYVQAYQLLKPAADGGSAEAQDYLGDMYVNGRGVGQDYVQAMTWYQKAADQNYADAENNLGNMYYNGSGVTSDYSQAMAWYQKGAALGFAESERNVGFLYDNGQGVTQDHALANEWYQKAVAQDNADAECDVGWQYQNGWGVSQDYGQAMAWYQKSAAQGNPRAEYYIGYLYEHGWGVDIDLSQARDWYQKASDGGDNDAKAWLQQHPQ